MPKIRQDIVDHILSNAKILDVAQECLGSYDPLSNTSGLRKNGARYIGLCPFHDDTHATNFSVYPPTNCYKCFACGAKGGPVDFVMKYENLTFPDAIRWLGAFYKEPVDDVPVDYTPQEPKPAPPPLPILTLPMYMVKAREHTEIDPFCNWLRGLDLDGAAKARIEPVLKMYHVGHSRKGHTIFWQIDENGVVRTAHMMKYNPDGHRIKKEQDPYSNGWAHRMLFNDKYLPQYDETKQRYVTTYFGMHLLNETKGDVNIVESEKTAIIMSVLYGHTSGVWMACWGKSNLNSDKMKPIIEAKRRIVLFPDHDGVEDWKEQAEFIDYDNLVVNTEPVRKWWIPEDGEKADIADVVLRMMDADKRSYKTEALDEIVTRSDAVRLLKERLKLKPK